MKRYPYDRESYRESKLRRRRVMMADETGRYVPVHSPRRKMMSKLFIVLLAVMLVLIGIAVYFLYLEKDDPKKQYQRSPEDEELLRIIDRQNQLEPTYEPELTSFEGIKINSIAYDGLKELTEEAKSKGVNLKIDSGYISYSDQQSLYETTLEKIRSEGNLSLVRAEAQTVKTVPKAGCSEAQTGLLVDFEVNDTATYSFLERNCVRFGFIRRYPESKTELTHHEADNSIYRYVGEENAEKACILNMCLEEYVNYLREGGRL